jgi:signal transduction histidine kinase
MTERRKIGVSFQARITAAAMATAVSVLLVACALFTLEQWGAERAMVIPLQKRVASILAAQIGLELQSGDQTEIQRSIDTASIFPRVDSATLRDRQGRVTAHYQRTGTGAGEGAPVDKAKGLIQTTVPVSYDGRPLGVLAVTVRSESAASFLPRYLALTGALFFAATALSLFVGRLLAKRLIEPVDRLSLIMGEVAASGDLSRRVERLEDNEFGRLIDSFNALLNRLQANDRDLRDTLAALVIARDGAEAANVQKSQFLANMSHEIRTPLNGVLAMTQVMALGELAPEQQGRLDVIRSSGEALLTILNDILDVSKIEAGMLELETVEFDPERLVRGAVGGFDAVADAKDLQLILEIGAEATGPRLGDPARLRQILSNLISNALKFTPAGAVRVSMEGRLEEGVDRLRLVVADSGIGMAADKLPLLFHKFTQLDASTTRRFGGTGLGLSICMELTEKMGGQIWAESVEGEGSTFYVDLPMPRAAAEADPAGEDDALAEDQGPPLRVLAAEDNPTNQLVMTTILEIFGAELVMVENGRAAVEAWTAADFDVILMDIQMPEMDGIAAARAIREAEADSGRPRTPIIAVSANAMSHQVEEYMAAGMDGHVAKPIELGKLQAALEAALASRDDAEAA